MIAVEIAEEARHGLVIPLLNEDFHDGLDCLLREISPRIPSQHPAAVLEGLFLHAESPMALSPLKQERFPRFFGHVGRG